MLLTYLSVISLLLWVIIIYTHVRIIVYVCVCMSKNGDRQYMTSWIVLMFISVNTQLGWFFYWIFKRICCNCIFVHLSKKNWVPEDIFMENIHLNSSKAISYTNKVYVRFFSISASNSELCLSITLPQVIYSGK